MEWFIKNEDWLFLVAIGILCLIAIGLGILTAYANKKR